MQIPVEANMSMRHFDHPLLVEARAKSQQAVAQTIELLRERNRGQLPKTEYIETGPPTVVENSLFDQGYMLLLDRLTGQASNASTAFYLALFSSDTTLLATFDGDFGAASGGDVTEFIGYDETARPEVTFGATTLSGNSYLCTYDSAETITIATGVSNVTIYGAILTDQATKRYSSGSGKAISGMRYPSSTRPVVSAGQIKQMSYQFYATRAMPTS